MRQDYFIDLPSLNISKRALTISICLHLSLPFVILTVQWIEKTGIFSTKTELKKENIQSYIQVDVVALPDELIKDRPNPDVMQPIVDKVKKIETPVEQKQQEAAMELPAKKENLPKESLVEDRRKAQEKALKKMAEEAKRESALKALAKKEAKSREEKIGRKKMAGNILSKGTASSGALGAAKEQYTALVAEAIKSHFNIFPWQKKKNLVAVVYLEIFPTGKLKERRLLQKSSDSTFDTAVLQAVELSQPLPVPEDLSVVKEGITIEFKPE